MDESTWELSGPGDEPDEHLVLQGDEHRLPGDLGPNAVAYGAGGLGAVALGLAAFIKRRRMRRRLDELDD